jgi:hypothetical protein
VPVEQLSGALTLRPRASQTVRLRLPEPRGRR